MNNSESSKRLGDWRVAGNTLNKLEKIILSGNQNHGSISAGWKMPQVLGGNVAADSSPCLDAPDPRKQVLPMRLLLLQVFSDLRPQDGIFRLI